MNDPRFDTIDVVKESIEKRKKHLRSIKRRRAIKRFLIVLVFGLMLFGLYSIDQSDLSRIQSIRITGNTYIPEAEIVEKLEVKIGDRMLFNWASKLDGRLSNLVGLDTSSTTIYYNQGLVNVILVEKTPVGYVKGETLAVIYADGSRRNLTADTFKSIQGLPEFIGFSEEQLNSELLKAFENLAPEVILAISEVHRAPESYDALNLKLVMNNNYFVYSSVGALPLLRSYASIIDRTEPDYRCIYLLEYGPTNESQIATAKRCEE